MQQTQEIVQAGSPVLHQVDLGVPRQYSLYYPDFHS